MSLVATEVVVLHAFDYLESSRIIRLATRELGVQSVVARGVRKSKSRFGSSLDVFASGIAQFNAKPGRDLHTLTGFDVTRSRIALAANLQRFAAASALAELALAFAHGGSDGDANVFDVLTEALDALIAAEDDEAVDAGLAYAWRIVAALGFSPSLDACAVCRADVPDESAAPFSHSAGGVVCARCRTSVFVSRTLPAEARLTLRRWAAGEDAHAVADGAARRAHLRLLREFVQHHVAEGRELRALAAWESSLKGRQ